MKNIVYLSLGSNIGDRERNLKYTISNIDNHESLNIISQSSFYETSPLYNDNQDNFYNSVIKIETYLKPLSLLKLCKKIEKEIGREDVSKRNMPRLIDVDIIVYNNKILKTKELIVPHPKLHERKFVLVPMHEIEPGFIFPDSKSVDDLLNVIEDSSKIIKLNKNIS